MRNLCPSCGQVRPQAQHASLTASELDALSAWWLIGSTKGAADLLGRAQRTVINQLYKARMRNGVHTTTQLAQLQLGNLRSMRDLIAQHNRDRRKAA